MCRQAGASEQGVWGTQSEAQTHFTPSPWGSSTQPPLDEGHAVISLAPQWGAAQVVQVLSQLDQGLLHSAPGGWGGKAGIQ